MKLWVDLIPTAVVKDAQSLLHQHLDVPVFPIYRCGNSFSKSGNVIGGGDWSKDRLILDVLRSYNQGDQVIIRNPKATRPCEYVIEPLSGYLILAEELYNKAAFAEPFNYPRDEDCQSVESILNTVNAYWEDCPGLEIRR